MQNLKLYLKSVAILLLVVFIGGKLQAQPVLMTVNGIGKEVSADGLYTFFPTCVDGTCAENYYLYEWEFRSGGALIDYRIESRPKIRFASPASVTVSLRVTGIKTEDEHELKPALWEESTESFTHEVPTPIVGPGITMAKSASAMIGDLWPYRVVPGETIKVPIIFKNPTLCELRLSSSLVAVGSIESATGVEGYEALELECYLPIEARCDASTGVLTYDVTVPPRSSKVFLAKVIVPESIVIESDIKFVLKTNFPNVSGCSQLQTDRIYESIGVRQSIDPNSKSPTKKLAEYKAGETVTYNIRFQNIGKTAEPRIQIVDKFHSWFVAGSIKIQHVKIRGIPIPAGRNSTFSWARMYFVKKARVNPLDITIYLGRQPLRQFEWGEVQVSAILKDKIFLPYSNCQEIPNTAVIWFSRGNESVHCRSNPDICVKKDS